MIGKFKKTSFLFVLAVFTASLTGVAHADCSAFEEEANSASDGIFIRFNENNSVAAVVAIGEATFLVPKRSLIKKARLSAELSAKRVFSTWLKEVVAGGTTATSLADISEKTDQDGNTSGVVEELSVIGETMASSSASILEGLVKLDECVDTEDLYILVELGWKPELSKAAKCVQDENESECKAEQNVSNSAVGKSKIKPAEGYRKKSPLKDDF